MIKTVSTLALTLLLGSTSTTMHAQDWAKAALEKSPRHHEYVSLKNGTRTVPTFVVYPEVKGKAPVIVMMGEITGLTDWAKNLADELAGQGFIVVAPDVLAGSGPNGGGSDSFPSQETAIKAASALSNDQVMGDLDAAADYGKKLPAGDGKIFVAGFCWGGGKSFAYATHRHDLTAAFVFYGEGPADVTPINAPVYGFYGEKDARIDAGLPATTDAMKAAGKKFDPVIYKGAGHGFMRAGEAPDAAPEVKLAQQDGFKRFVSLVKKLNAGQTARVTPHAKTQVVAMQKAKAPATVSCHEGMATSADGTMIAMK